MSSAFLAGYLVEKSLSLDNVFVFLLVFTGYGLAVADRHRVLTYGIVLENVRSGGIFGEMALIDDGPRSAAAMAAEPTEVVTIDKPTFLAVVRDNPQFALTVMSLLAVRLRRFEERHLPLFLDTLTLFNRRCRRVDARWRARCSLLLFDDHRFLAALDPARGLERGVERHVDVPQGDFFDLHGHGWG